MSAQPPPENPLPPGSGQPPPGYWQPPPGGPPPWRPPPAIDESRVRPRKLWYFVAAAVFAACVIGAVVLGYFTVKGVFGPVTNFTAPGSADVRLDAGEGRSIYQRGDESFPREDVRCEVRGLESGSRPGLSQTVGDFKITRGDERTGAYLALLDFEAPVADSYRVTCRGARADLAVGPKAAVGSFIARIFGAIGLFFTGIVLGAAVAVPTLVMRNRHRERLQNEAIVRGG